MKKLLIAVFALLSLNIAHSQKFGKKVTASDKNIADLKKGINPATWLARGELFYDIANEPGKDVLVGMDETTYKLLLAGVKYSEETEVVEGEQLKVHVYSDKKVYLNDGRVALVYVTKYEENDPFKKSYDAYMKAIELDVNKKNTKKLALNLRKLANLAKNEGFNRYTFGKNTEALSLFELAAECSASPVIGEIDSMMHFYAGALASEEKMYDKAEKHLRKSIEIGYVKEGNVHAVLADVLTESNKKDEARELLEKGLTAFPQNQAIIIALINNYASSNKDARDIIPLLTKAQEANPNDIDLHILEGQLYQKLSDYDKAAEKFKKAIAMDNNSFSAYSCIGTMYFNRGAEYTEQGMAKASDIKESDRLMGLANEQLKIALPYLEKAFGLDNTNKDIVQALKDINFRFRNENETYKQNSDKYIEILSKM